MLRTLFAIFLMATLVVAIIFAVSNYQEVSINYLFGERSVPLSFLIFLPFLLGLLFGVSLDAWIMFRQRSRIRHLEKGSKSMQEELANLRKIPLKDLND